MITSCSVLNTTDNSKFKSTFYSVCLYITRRQTWIGHWCTRNSQFDVSLDTYIWCYLGTLGLILISNHDQDLGSSFGSGKGLSFSRSLEKGSSKLNFALVIFVIEDLWRVCSIEWNGGISKISLVRDWKLLLPRGLSIWGTSHMLVFYRVSFHKITFLIQIVFFLFFLTLVPIETLSFALMS